jgi:hypothetical protein
MRTALQSCIDACKGIAGCSSQVETHPREQTDITTIIQRMLALLRVTRRGSAVLLPVRGQGVRTLHLRPHIMAAAASQRVAGFITGAFGGCSGA